MMRSCPWGHRRADAFADSLDGREPNDREITHLVRLAETLCVAAAEQPDQGFVQHLRARLMNDAATTLVPAKPPTRVHRAQNGIGPVVD